MPLKSLNLAKNPVTDLSPLRGMQLQLLSLSATAVSDLSPLAGMPLKTLRLGSCKNLTDISPVLEIRTLEELIVPTVARNLELLRKLPKLKTLAFNFVEGTHHVVGSTVADFWKKWETLTWMRALNDAGIPYSATEITEGIAQAASPNAKSLSKSKKKKAAAESAAKRTRLRLAMVAYAQGATACGTRSRRCRSSSRSCPRCKQARSPGSNNSQRRR